MSRPGASVGWVGLGAIGLPMAARAAARGFTVIGWDPSPQRREAAAAAGIELAADSAETGRRAERLVVCVVRSADQVADSLLGPAGALAGADRCGVVMSSIGAVTMRELGARARAAGRRLLDAPILGNAIEAEEGSLTIPLAGPAADRDAARPLLETFARSVPDLGEDLGRAQTVKGVSQQLQILGMVAAIEALALAASDGVEEETMLAILNATAPSWASRRFAYAHRLWREGDREGPLGLFAKDLDAVLADAAAAGLEMPLTERGRALLEARMRS